MKQRERKRDKIQKKRGERKKEMREFNTVTEEDAFFSSLSLSFFFLLKIS